MVHTTAPVSVYPLLGQIISARWPLLNPKNVELCVLVLLAYLHSKFLLLTPSLDNCVGIVEVGIDHKSTCF